MPTIRDFKGMGKDKKRSMAPGKSHHGPAATSSRFSAGSEAKPARAKRRPGREEEADHVPMASQIDEDMAKMEADSDSDVDSAAQMAFFDDSDSAAGGSGSSASGSSGAGSGSESGSGGSSADRKAKMKTLESEVEADTEEDRVEISFRGSELLRTRFPKSFEVAEAVATDWMRDGKFENLPLPHPLVQWVAQQGLLKAKDIEKKVVESPAVEKALITALTMGLKAQTLAHEVRGKLKDQVGERLGGKRKGRSGKHHE